MFKKGMMLYTKKVDDASLGHQVNVILRVYRGSVDQVTYDNPFMPIPDEFKGLVGNTMEEVKAQGFVLERVVLEEDGLPEYIEEDEVDLFENSDILNRPTMHVDLNMKFFDEIITVEQAKNDEERYNALAALGEAVYFMSLGEDDEDE